MLALDYGSARTGVAVSDPTGTLARPLGSVEQASTEDGMRRLVDLIRAESPERVVVGLPLTLRGERGALVEQAVRTYAARLEHHCLQAPYNWFNFYDFWNGARR